MIRVRSRETDTSPVDLGSYSSRVTFMNANAAISAAMEIRKDLLAAASKITNTEITIFIFSVIEIVNYRYRSNPFPLLDDPFSVIEV